MAEASELLPSGSGPSNDPRSAACRHLCAPGPSPMSVLAQYVQPSADRLKPTGGDKVRRVPVHQAGRREGVSTRQPVPDRLLGLALLLVPPGG
jgi:hypothetical protein